jgi:uncharacterized membrane protein YbjE (DUF340 family)
MGYEFGSYTDDLYIQFIHIGKIFITFTFILFIFNFLAISLFIKNSFYKPKPSNAKRYPNYTVFIQESSKYILLVLLGIGLGRLLRIKLTIINPLISSILFIVLFIIGRQLRLQNIALKHIFLNKTGLKISTLIIISSLAGGAVGAWILNLPLQNGLILSCGFGWYSLSGILDTRLIDQNFGTAAFFIDFLRELIAIILLPSIGRLFPTAIVGYCGATAMDFSLPIIKENLGEQIVPIAISSGMILSIIVPVLLPLLAKL